MTKLAISGEIDPQVALNGRIVAVVDDDDIFRSYLTLMLMPLGVRVDPHANSDSLMAKLERQMPDCIFLDYDILHENGLFVQQQLLARFPNLAPVVIMSADETQRTVVRALRSGVDDFIQKRGLKLDEVETALRRVIAKRETGSPNLRAGARGAGAIDHVTGLFSRTEFDAKLSAISELSDRTGATVGVLAIHFSSWSAIAMQLGLVMAERVLRGFATRLSSSVGPEFLCSRFSDDVLCCLVERVANAAQMTEGARALKVAMTYSQNIGAARFVIEPHIEARTWSPGGPPLVDLIAELAALFDAERNESVKALSVLATTTADHSALPESHPFTGAERRRSVRRRVFKRGTVALHDGASRLPCTIRNLSEGGACIRLESTLVTPEQFTLSLGDGERPRKVRKRWQTNYDLGVEFLD